MEGAGAFITPSILMVSILFVCRWCVQLVGLLVRWSVVVKGDLLVRWSVGKGGLLVRWSVHLVSLCKSPRAVGGCVCGL